ncbi:MAG: hypothetical protein EP314_08475 [Bacteroidetes bacterium]|nr:MAG: hypothetical protein EP314_08475 [Bacteroidota bacterium]
MAILNWDRNTISALIFGISMVLFVPFLGSTHLFDWDEVNFAEAAREMLVTGEYTYVQINFKPFWEKPPLFIWMQALSMKVFGINEFAARFPNAICGAVSLTVLFRLGSALVSNSFGLLWTLVYVGSMLPQFYFRSGIIDPWFNLFIFSGVLFLIRASETNVIQRKSLILSAVMIGLAVLTKGPTALAIVGVVISVYFVLSFRQHQWKLADAAIYLTVVLAVGFSWFLLELLRGHGYVIKEAIDYHIRLFAKGEAGHAQPFFYHPLVLLFGCFPMSLFFIFSWFGKSDKPDNIRHFGKWMSILFWVVLIVFSIVKTKIVHYSSLAYFPMSFMASWTLHEIMIGKRKFGFTHFVVVAIFIVLLGTAFVLSGIIGQLREPLLGLLHPNTLAYGSLSQEVADGFLDPFVGVFFLVSAMLSAYSLYLGATHKGVVALFSTTLITVWLLVVLIAPKVDRYAQAALFSFYKQHAETAYLQPIGFHSYAHLFYGKRTPLPVKTDDEPLWLLFEKIDRPVYFISKLQDVEKTLGYFPHLTVTDTKGGYAILERTDENYPFIPAP